MGIKDSFYNFNVDKKVYNELLEQMGGERFKKVDYVLVHNIIYTGYEYALEIGFKPHKNFTNITINILEEDTEDIELIEIECGRNGKPLFIPSIDDTPEKINQITKILQKFNKNNES